MAKKPAQQQAPQQQALRQDKGGKILWSALIIIFMVIIALPTVLIVFFGMMPSIVAFIIDRSEEKYSTFCVAGMNFTAVFKYLMDLWVGENSIDMALKILSDIFALMWMYSASGFGWMLFASVPPVIVAFLVVMAQRRVVVLRSEQKILIEEWGEKVAGIRDEDEVS